MILIDYIVHFKDKNERKEFIEYMHKLGYNDLEYEEDELLSSDWPMGICIKHKIITTTRGTIACFNMQKNGQLKNVEEMKKILEQR